MNARNAVPVNRPTLSMFFLLGVAGVVVALAMTPTAASAAKPLLRPDPHTVNLGTVTADSGNVGSSVLTNVSDTPVTITAIENSSNIIIYSEDSSCDVGDTLAPGDQCALTIAVDASGFTGRESTIFEVYGCVGTTTCSSADEVLLARVRVQGRFQ